MNRGDVVRVELPRPAGPPGREQFGSRPAIVLQHDGDIASLPTVLIVPLTSRLAAIRFPGAFTVSPTGVNGLDVESVVLTHQLRAIDRGCIRGVIGRLDSNDLAKLESQTRSLLGL